MGKKKSTKRGVLPAASLPPQSSSSSSHGTTAVAVADNKYMELLKHLNDSIEVTVLEKVLYDAVNKDIIQLNKIEGDIQTKISTIKELSMKTNDDNDIIIKKISSTNSRLSQFKEITQKIDLMYVQTEEDIVNLFKEVNASSELEVSIEEDIRKLHQETNNLKELEDKNEKSKRNDADNTLKQSNQIFMSNVNLLESIIDGIQLCSKEYDNMKNDMRLKQTAQLYNSL